jgi:2-(1,2-epoxy-1,2-dihydrophenyl)acetyl-CoA isomerase
MGEITVARNAGIVRVTLDNPGKKNAICNTMWQQLGDVLAEVTRTGTDRVLVLAGVGGDFCAGVEMDPASANTHATQLERLEWMNERVLALHNLPVPTIAQVDGIAAGMGMNLALCCDLVLASEHARFSEIFIKRALSVDGGGTWLLPRLIGAARAKELCFFGDMLAAPEALGMGLVNRVTAPAELPRLVDAWAARLARGPRVALAGTKRLLNEAHSVSLPQALENEVRLQCLNVAGDDFREAVTAFRDKREPQFRG